MTGICRRKFSVALRADGQRVFLRERTREVRCVNGPRRGPPVERRSAWGVSKDAPVWGGR